MKYPMENYDNVTPERANCHKWSFLPRQIGVDMPLVKVLDMLWVDFNIRSFPIDFDELKLENDLYGLSVGAGYRVLTSEGRPFLDLQKTDNDSFVITMIYGLDYPVNVRRICSDASATGDDGGFGRTFMGTGGNSYVQSQNSRHGGYRDAA